MSSRLCLFYRQGLAAKPVSYIIRKQRRKSSVDPFVIFIKPCESLRSKEFRQHGASVEMTASKGLEIEPVTEFADSCLPAKDNVLMSYSVHSLPVKSRLV